MKRSWKMGAHDISLQPQAIYVFLSPNQDGPDMMQDKILLQTFSEVV